MNILFLLLILGKMDTTSPNTLQGQAHPHELNGQYFSVADIFDRVVDERRIPFSTPTPIPGNTVAGRIKEKR